MKELVELATSFRKAIEMSDRRALGSSFENFPHGSCGDASLLLGAFLIDHGITPLKYVAGQRGEWSHAWLENGNIIIDITSDQFEDSNEAIIVTGSSPWHDLFDDRDENLPDFREYDKNYAGRMSGPYFEVLRHL